MQLSKACGEMLNAAEQRVTELTRSDSPRVSDIFELSASRLSAVWTQVKASIQPGSGTLLQAMDYSMAPAASVAPCPRLGACQSLARPIELADRAACR